MKTKSLSAVSLFSGCGGFCEGIERAGFRIQVGVESDRYAADTYRHNFPSVPLFDQDIATFLRPRSISHRKRYKLEAIDLVFGGPPCQGYSQIGTRNIDDERNSLYKEFARVVRVLRPRIFLMENVPNLILLKNGYYRDLIVRHFVGLGYSNATFVLVTASDYGVPQNRRRVIIIGTRDEDYFPFDLKEFCETTLKTLRTRSRNTVWDAIGDLPKRIVDSGETMPYPKRGAYSSYQKLMRLDFSRGVYKREVMRLRGIAQDRIALHNHHTKDMQERWRKLIRYLAPGEKATSLPKHVWSGGRPGKWRRLHPDRPSYTILAQMHRDLSEWVHPKLDRWITVREAARLQAFHDGFVFVSSEWQQLKQIGNAVPPLLAFALGQMAAEAIAELTK